MKRELEMSDLAATGGDFLRRSMAALMGIDVNSCELCEQPLGDAKDWKRGLDGAAAHLVCLRRMGVRA